MSWPTSLVLVAFIAALVVLGVTHVVDGQWIERSLTALAGAVLYGVGHAIGTRRATDGAGFPSKEGSS